MNPYASLAEGMTIRKVVGWGGEFLSFISFGAFCLA